MICWIKFSSHIFLFFLACDFSFFFFSEQQSVVSAHESSLWIMMSSRGYMCGKSSRYWDLRLVIINFQWLRVRIRCHSAECNIKKSEIFRGVVSLQLHPPLLCVSQIWDFSRFFLLFLSSEWIPSYSKCAREPKRDIIVHSPEIRTLFLLLLLIFFVTFFPYTCQTQILTPSSYRPAQSRCIQRAKMKLEKTYSVWLQKSWIMLKG